MDERDTRFHLTWIALLVLLAGLHLGKPINYYCLAFALAVIVTTFGKEI